MSLTPEELFYSTQNHVECIQWPTSQTASAFGPGSRYAIVNESLKHTPLPCDGIILELGCYKGEKLLWLKSNFHFSKAIGIDLCFSRQGYEGKDYSFFSANLNQSWPLASQSVDVLVAMMLLEHLFDPFESFREIKRLLSPSGRAFVNLPLITSYKNRMRLLFGRMPITSVPYARWLEEGHWDGFHLHNFTIPAIIDLARGAGLFVYKMKSVGKLSGVKDVWPSLLCDEISFELRHASI
jgi:SAM-dependent methyltransferase